MKTETTARDKVYAFVYEFDFGTSPRDFDAWPRPNGTISITEIDKKWQLAACAARAKLREMMGHEVQLTLRDFSKVAG